MVLIFEECGYLPLYLLKVIEKEVRISHPQMSSIFRNPFYCGLLSDNLIERQVVDGYYEKLISNEIFLKVNEVQYRNA